MLFPEKCYNCPFVKCRALHYFSQSSYGITSGDIKDFFENYLISQGKPSFYNKSTPRKILERLRKSHWLYRKFKESRSRGKRGRLAWVHYFDKKAKDYLKKYESFLVGPLCRKEIKRKVEEKGKTIEIKPKIKEEIIIFGKEND